MDALLNERTIGDLNISLQQDLDGIKAHSGLERANAPSRHSTCSANIDRQVTPRARVLSWNPRWLSLARKNAAAKRTLIADEVML
jgi:hypothetical protein